MSTTDKTSKSKHPAQESETPSLERNRSDYGDAEARDAVATKVESGKAEEECPRETTKADAAERTLEHVDEDEERVSRAEALNSTHLLTPHTLRVPEEVVWSKAAAAADFLPEGVKDEGEYPLPSRSWGWKRAPEAVSEEVARANRAAAKADFLPAGVVDEGEGPAPSRKQGWKGFDAASKAKLLTKLQGSGEGERDAEVGDQQS